MAINYTYPIKANPVVTDDFLIIDNEDTVNIKATKRVTVSSVVALASGGSGETYDLSASTNGSNVDLNLISTSAADDSTVQLTAGSNITLTRNSAAEITVGVSSSPTFTGDVTAPDFIGDLNGAVRFTGKAIGSAILAGEVVYISGISGNTPEVSLAQSNSSATMPAFGIALADIAQNNTDEIATLGSVRGLNVTDFGESGITFSVGDILYVSSTEVGKITNVPPTGDANLLQNIGIIQRANPTSNMTIKVGGAGRTNATPNLNDGNVFVGNASNQSVARALAINDLSDGTTFGNQNLGLGSSALSSLTSGGANTALGINALRLNTTGPSNTASGYYALFNNTTGSENTASGALALFLNTTGSSNTALGSVALEANTGSHNTASGANALRLNTTGNYNIGIGVGAGDAITTGSNNTIIGDYSGTTSLSDTVVIAAGLTERLKITATSFSVNGTAGASGSFVASGGETVTVVNGIITIIA